MMFVFRYFAASVTETACPSTVPLDGSIRTGMKSRSAGLELGVSVVYPVVLAPLKSPSELSVAVSISMEAVVESPLLLSSKISLVVAPSRERLVLGGSESAMGPLGVSEVFSNTDC